MPMEVRIYMHLHRDNCLLTIKMRLGLVESRTVPCPDLDFQVHEVHSLDLVASMGLRINRLHLPDTRVSTEVRLVSINLQGVWVKLCSLCTLVSFHLQGSM
jgi:hypothetical protein